MVRKTSEAAESATFNFEENQWDFGHSTLYVWDPEHISYFFFTKTKERSYTFNYEDGDYAAANDVLFTNVSGFTVNGATDVWRTLTYDEWYYLLKSRKVNGYTDFGATCAWAQLNNGINGLIIFHDGYTGQTTGLTSIPDGCVFLPAGGYRNGGIGNMFEYGEYLASTSYDASNLYTASFNEYNLWVAGPAQRWSTSVCVRLVRNVPVE